jgi:hypothetical protein
MNWFLSLRNVKSGAIILWPYFDHSTAQPYLDNGWEPFNAVMKDGKLVPVVKKNG